MRGSRQNVCSRNNRISIGAQSFVDRRLREIGRTHSAQAAIDAVIAAKNANICEELIFIQNTILFKFNQL